MKSKFTPELEDKVIELIEKEGYISIVCGMLEISRGSFEYHMNTDELFRERVNIAKGKFCKKIKDKMIEAGKDKKTQDWRVYENILATIDQEFNRYRFTKGTAPISPKNITFVFGNLEEGIKKGEQILKNTIPSKILQSSSVKLINAPNLEDITKEVTQELKAKDKISEISEEEIVKQENTED